MSAERLIDLSPRVLRDLAAALEARSPEAQLRRDLPEDAIDELAEMLSVDIEPDGAWWAKWEPQLLPEEIYALGCRLRDVADRNRARLRARRLQRVA